MTKPGPHRGLVRAELSTDAWMAETDAYLRKLLGHPAEDAVFEPPKPRAPRTPGRKKPKAAKATVRVDQQKKTV